MKYANGQEDGWADLYVLPIMR